MVVVEAFGERTGGVVFGASDLVVFPFEHIDPDDGRPIRILADRGRSYRGTLVALAEPWALVRADGPIGEPFDLSPNVPPGSLGSSASGDPRLDCDGKLYGLTNAGGQFEYATGIQALVEHPDPTTAHPIWSGHGGLGFAVEVGSNRDGWAGLRASGAAHYQGRLVLRLDLALTLGYADQPGYQPTFGAMMRFSFEPSFGYRIPILGRSHPWLLVPSASLGGRLIAVGDAADPFTKAQPGFAGIAGLGLAVQHRVGVELGYHVASKVTDTSVLTHTIWIGTYF
jgi:hypothetical protein